MKNKAKLANKKQTAIAKNKKIYLNFIFQKLNKVEDEKSIFSLHLPK
ncbi:hypothetical protein [Providencia huaxiensis]